MNKIPQNLQKYFWDTNFDTLSITKNSTYIIERILEYGTLNDDKWLKSIYSLDQIIEAIKKSRKISMKTANFYSFIFNINPEEIECFKKPFTQKQNRF